MWAEDTQFSVVSSSVQFCREPKAALKYKAKSFKSEYFGIKTNNELQ